MKKKYPLFSKIKLKKYDVFIPFICWRCGSRCRQFLPHFSEEDLENAAKYLQQPPEEIRKRYEDYFRKRHSRTPPGCIFLKGRNTCTIYPIRPDACRLYPFSFDGSDTRCPGYREHSRLVAAMRARRKYYRIYDSSFCPEEEVRTVPEKEWPKLLQKFIKAKPSRRMIKAFIGMNQIPEKRIDKTA